MAKKKGLWDNIHAKRKRGESPAKKGSKDYPETLDIGEGMKAARKNVGADTCWDGYKAKGTKKKDGKEVPNCVKEGKSFAEFCAEGKSRIETDPDYRKRFKALADNFAEKRKEQTSTKKTRKESVEILDVDGNLVAEITDLILPDPMTGWKQQIGEGAIADKMRANLKAKKKSWDEKGEKAKKDGYDALDKVKKTQDELEKSDYIQNVGESAWQRKEGKNKAGGLNEKGRKSYERENPGSDLKAPQPEGGPRKKSFCARMGGMKGPLKDEKGKPTRKKLALDKWKC